MKIGYLRPEFKEWEYRDSTAELPQIQHLLDGGYLEAIPNMHTNATIYGDEESKLKELMENVYLTNGVGMILEVICGPLVMVGPPDKNGNDTNLTEALFKRTIKHFVPLR